MMMLYRPNLTDLQKEKLHGKPGAPWKHGTREADLDVVDAAYRDIRLEERFFLGNVIKGMPLKETEGNKRMTRYSPNQAERERGREPHAFARIENEYGHVELGADKKKEYMTIVAAQKIDADRKTLPNSAKRLDGRQATPVRATLGERGGIMMASHHLRQSALAFKTRERRGYRDALSLMGEIKRRGGSETIEEMLPFLSKEEEVEAERELSETMRGERQSSKKNAIALRLHHVQRIRRLKEQRKKEFMQNLNIAIERHRRGKQVGDEIMGETQRAALKQLLEEDAQDMDAEDNHPEEE